MFLDRTISLTKYDAWNLDVCPDVSVPPRLVSKEKENIKLSNQYKGEKFGMYIFSSDWLALYEVFHYWWPLWGYISARRWNVDTSGRTCFEI